MQRHICRSVEKGADQSTTAKSRSSQHPSWVRPIGWADAVCHCMPPVFPAGCALAQGKDAPPADSCAFLTPPVLYKEPKLIAMLYLSSRGSLSHGCPFSGQFSECRLNCTSGDLLPW